MREKALSELEFQNVSYVNNGKEILHDLSIDFSPGSYVSIIGPSGSGKSTFLRLCCNLISPTKGTVLFHGKDVLQQNPIELRKKIGYCFQEPVLWGNTVDDNLSFPFQVRKQEIDEKKISGLLASFGLDERFRKSEIKNLSGGEKQRVALIRTLLFEPEILLLDEVTSALDADNTGLVEKAILGLNQRGITVLWVTHNDAQSRKYADQLLTIENGRIKSLEAIK